jgi:two-component system chemotaxis response regulator CheB
MTCALVVDDSQFMRTVVGNELREDGYDVVEASNGKQALEKVDEHEPDVITMDVEMPEMDGIEATERIMEWRPTPILMVSAYTDDGAEATLDALENGAVDFIQKPDGEEVSIETEPMESELREKVQAAVEADPDALAPLEVPAPDADVAEAGDGETLAASASAPAPDAGAGTEEEPAAPSTAEEISSVIEGQLADEYVDQPTIVVGASTGGPKLINAMMRALPRALDARVLVVQHMPASFTDRFAARLDAMSAYDVAEAEDGERIDGGEVRVARGGEHLAVASYSSGRLRLSVTEDDPVHGVRPSIDVTMQSAAEVVEGPLIGVVLTGMGSDGAAGVEAIKAAGGTTFAQDEATSPVFGIPEQAIATGAVDRVLPADEIVEGVVEALGKEGD